MAILERLICLVLDHKFVTTVVGGELVEVSLIPSGDNWVEPGSYLFDVGLHQQEVRQECYRCGKRLR